MVNYAGAYAVGILMPIISTIFIACRYIALKQRHNTFAPDNLVLTFGLILVWAMSGLFLNGASRHIFGGHTPINPVTHTVVITPEGLGAAALQWGFLLVDRLAFGVIKIGIVLWYRSIFVTQGHQGFARLSLCVMVMLAVWSLTYCALDIFACGSHPSLAWSHDLKATVSKCLNTQLIQVTFTVTDAFTDLIVLSLPIPWVLKLHLTTRKKIGLIMTFSMGLISTGAGIARMAIWIWITYRSDTFNRDFLGLLTTALTWSLVSTNTAIIGACLPAMKSLLQTKPVENAVHTLQKGGRRSKSSVSAVVTYLVPTLGSKTSLKENEVLVDPEAGKKSTVVQTAIF